MTTASSFGGFNNSTRPIGPDVKVTDILIRGGGGTITFSDNITVEFVYGFRPDDSIPAGGTFDITLIGDRAQRVYETVVSQAICNMIDWLLQCSDLARRISVLELTAGIAKQFDFVAGDWDAGTANTIEIPASGVLLPGQIGPHGFATNRAFLINVWKEDGFIVPVIVGVDVELNIGLTTGLITLKKAPLATSFAGKVIIS
jgi:hypothetical protein